MSSYCKDVNKYMSNEDISNMKEIHEFSQVNKMTNEDILGDRLESVYNTNNDNMVNDYEQSTNDTKARNNVITSYSNYKNNRNMLCDETNHYHDSSFNTVEWIIRNKDSLLSISERYVLIFNTLFQRNGRSFISVKDVLSYINKLSRSLLTSDQELYNAFVAAVIIEYRSIFNMTANEISILAHIFTGLLEHVLDHQCSMMARQQIVQLFTQACHQPIDNEESMKPLNFAFKVILLMQQRLQRVLLPMPNVSLSAAYANLMQLLSKRNRLWSNDEYNSLFQPQISNYSNIFNNPNCKQNTYNLEYIPRLSLAVNCSMNSSEFPSIYKFACDTMPRFVNNQLMTITSLQTLITGRVIQHRKSTLRELFDKTIKWKSNLITLPKCNESSNFIRVLSTLYNDVCSEIDQDGSYLLKATLLCQLVLQRFDSRKVAVIQKELQRRLAQWESEDYDSLFEEGCVLQSNIPMGRRKSALRDWKNDFCKQMSIGNTTRATRILEKEGALGGIHSLSSEVDGKSVSSILKEKHPEAAEIMWETTVQIAARQEVSKRPFSTITALANLEIIISRKDLQHNIARIMKNNLHSSSIPSVNVSETVTLECLNSLNTDKTKWGLDGL
ncbi:hypothetical protein GJ496_011336 [Pomphorhynchus laevis]|nr:hypothetical protein GJ496_011336 [Pomphorhynchus laevis]